MININLTMQMGDFFPRLILCTRHVLQHSDMTYPSIQQRHPRVTGEQIEERPEGEKGEEKSISHFRQLEKW